MPIDTYRTITVAFVFLKRVVRIEKTITITTFNSPGTKIASTWARELWDSTGFFWRYAHMQGGRCVTKFRDVQAVLPEHQRTRAVVRMYCVTGTIWFCGNVKAESTGSTHIRGVLHAICNFTRSQRVGSCVPAPSCPSELCDSTAHQRHSHGWIFGQCSGWYLHGSRCNGSQEGSSSPCNRRNGEDDPSGTSHWPSVSPFTSAWPCCVSSCPHNKPEQCIHHIRCYTSHRTYCYRGRISSGGQTRGTSTWFDVWPTCSRDRLRDSSTWSTLCKCGCADI